MDTNPENQLAYLPKNGLPINILTKQVSEYHLAIRNQIPEADAQKAADQKPFKELQRPGDDSCYYSKERWAKDTEHYLEQQFNSLAEYKVSYKITTPAPLTEGFSLWWQKQKISSEMQGQIKAITRNYDSLSTLRTSFHHLWKHDQIQPHCILPMEFLPHLFLTAPVWYVDSKIRLPYGLVNTTDPAIRKLNSLINNQHFTNLFLIFNHMRRPFERYQGDIISPKILELLKKVKGSYDLLVIATPYTDIVSTEYETLPLPRLIDPYLLGFQWSTPGYFYFLHRWSNTGLFPLIEEMIANTMHFIQGGRFALDKLRQENNTNLHNWLRVSNGCNELDKYYGSDSVFQSIKKIKAAYEGNTVFEAIGQITQIPKGTTKIKI